MMTERRQESFSPAGVARPLRFLEQLSGFCCRVPAGGTITRGYAVDEGLGVHYPRHNALIAG